MKRLTDDQVAKELLELRETIDGSHIGGHGLHEARVHPSRCDLLEDASRRLQPPAVDQLARVHAELMKQPEEDVAIGLIAVNDLSMVLGCRSPVTDLQLQRARSIYFAPENR